MLANGIPVDVKHLLLFIFVIQYFFYFLYYQFILMYKHKANLTKNER